MPIESFKVLLPISFFGTWAGVLFLVYKWRGDKSMSISRHAASHKYAYAMMLIVQSITLPMFLVFVYKWFTPTFELPTMFSVLVSISMFTFLVAAYIPDVAGWRGRVHSLSAYFASLMLIPSLVILYLSENISNIPKGVILISALFQIIAVCVFSVFENAKNYHLYIQAIYFLLFDISLFAVTYIR